MADVFLMGTSGSIDDPHRSKWRDPIKAACTKYGISCFDPVVKEWNEAAMRAEIDALITARVIVMAITADTAGIGSLVESGWAALSAVQRKQAFGLYVDPMFVAEGFNASFSVASMDMVKRMLGTDDTHFQKKDINDLADASRRARKLVDGHANELAEQFPELRLYVAKSLPELRKWTIDTALAMLGKASQP